MKIVQLSSSDAVGGAYRAAYRLHSGLRDIGIDSRMLVQFKGTDDETVVGTHAKSRLGNTLARLRRSVDYTPLHLYGRYDQIHFSPAWLPDRIPSHLARLCPDVVNLHWICDGFMRLESLRHLRAPLVWTLHDMWPFTGGCHYSGTCERYTRNCGACPQLRSKSALDLSRWIWWRKRRSWATTPLTIVTPSHWLGERARASSLFRNCPVRVVPNGLDTQMFRPLGRSVARDLLGLPQSRQVVIFGALAPNDPRKGFQHLQSALQSLGASELHEHIQIVVFGASRIAGLSTPGLSVRYLGRLNDDITLALAYSAADVTVVPSVEENLPQVAAESLACGTPVVSFDSTGLRDLVDHRQNGYRAECFSPEDLANGILWVLEDAVRWQALSDAARHKAETMLSIEGQARAYLKLYQELAANAPCHPRVVG